MFIPWTVEERATILFPLLNETHVKKRLRLIKRIVASPQNLSPEKRRTQLQRLHQISNLFDIPEDIRKDDDDIRIFLQTLRGLVLRKIEFEKLCLGMQVKINERIGKVTKLNRRGFSVTIRFNDFYDDSETVSASGVSPYLKND